MATISKLSTPTPSYSISASSKLRSSLPQCLISFPTSSAAKASSFRLSVRRDGPLNGSLAVRCSQAGGNGTPVKRTTLHDLYEKEGQSPWYDNLCRPVTDLLPLIASGVRGVTSNPAIFQKAISSSNAYNDQFKELVQSGKDIETAYWELVVKDIQDACKLFESIYDQTDGGDGYVSVEVSPRLADDTTGTVEAAKWLHKVVDCSNVYIKIPAKMSLVPSNIVNMVICVLLMFLLNPTSCCAYGDGDTSKALFVFGDSLFDAGNNQYFTPTLYIPANHYPYGMSTDSATGRHSDGLLVPDFIAQYAGMNLIPPFLCPETANETFGYNFASAGAGCLENNTEAMNLPEQLVAFRNETRKLYESLGANETNKLLRNAVYLISMGGNDYLSYVSANKNASESQQKAFVAVIIGKLTAAIEEIYNVGGRKFAFQDVGPIGCLPTLKYFSNLTEGCYEYALNITELHNADLRKALKKVSQDYSDIKYGVFDYYNQLRNRILNPQNYGFTESEIACCGLGGFINGINCGMNGFLLCSNPSSFVMFDGAHTTQRTNSQLAQLMWSGNKSFIAPHNVKQLFQEVEEEGAIEMV